MPDSSFPLPSSLLHRRSLLAAALALPLLGHAQAWPARPIVMIVPQAPGGTNDIVGRLVSQKLAEVLGASVVVENRPGAGGNIGTQAVAKAPRDGHTLLMTISSSQAINPALYRKPGFDPVKDFRPIGLIGSVPNVLLAHPGFAAKSVPELISMARAGPTSSAMPRPATARSTICWARCSTAWRASSCSMCPTRAWRPRSTMCWAGRYRCCSAACRQRCPISRPAGCARWP